MTSTKYGRRAPWLLLLGILGCPAEQLGVEIPPRGVAALSVQDLSRDTRLLFEAPIAGRSKRIGRRLDAMSLDPAFSEGFTRAEIGTCGIARGGPSSGALVAALDDGESVVGGAASVAALISLAKVNDVGHPPAGDLIFCALEPTFGLERLLADPPVPFETATVITSLSDGGMSVSRSPGAVAVTTVASDGGEKTVEGLDYRRLLERVEAVHRLQREAAASSD